MPPAGDLQRRQFQCGQGARGRIHAHFGIEHDIGPILRDLIEPRLRRLGPLHEAIDPASGPIRFLVDDRARVVEKDLELTAIQMSNDSAQHHVPHRMLPHLAAHHRHSNAIAARLSEPLLSDVRAPTDGLCADQITIARQQATDIPGPVGQIERLMAARSPCQKAGIGAAPGAQLIE